MKKGLLIIISGPSGVGKGTLRAQVMKDMGLNLIYSISLTTRKIRPGELDGVDYHFVSEKVFKDNIASGNLLEYTRFVDHYYGTPKDQEERWRSEGKNVILEIEVNGAKKVMDACGDDKPVSIFILPPSFDELEKRIRHRSTEGEEVIKERLAKARRELSLAKNYKYTVVNDSIEKATAEIHEIIRREIASAAESI